MASEGYWHWFRSQAKAIELVPLYTTTIVSLSCLLFWNYGLLENFCFF
ncbi:hypothetical protein D082_26670 [Synechocystis sp. PCC 6714]|nr:hypothetical protein D082_26670 [Synechocystis sp. PCC 6714]